MDAVYWAEWTSALVGLFAEQEEWLPELAGVLVASADWFGWDRFPVPSYPEPVTDALERPDFCSAAAGGIRCCVVQLLAF